MVIVGGNNSLILEKTGIVTSYSEVRFYKNFIVLEKSENKFLIYFKF